MQYFRNFVKDKTVIGDLEKEQEKFCAEVDNNALKLGTVPWADLPDNLIAKKHILALSLVSST